MDVADQVAFDAVFNSKPYALCARHFSAVTRPRLWWKSHPLALPTDTEVDDRGAYLELTPQVPRDSWEVAVLLGWRPCAVVEGSARADWTFHCLTRHTPRSRPASHPRGLATASPGAVKRWRLDNFAHAPYQYEAFNMVFSPRTGDRRRLVSTEEESLHQVLGVTRPLLQRAKDEDWPPLRIERARRSLLGDSLHRGAAQFLLQCLLLLRLHVATPVPPVAPWLQAPFVVPRAAE